MDTLTGILATGKSIKEYTTWLGETIYELDELGVGFGDYTKYEDWNDEDSDEEDSDNEEKFTICEYNMYIPNPHDFLKVYEILDMSVDDDYLVMNGRKHDPNYVYDYNEITENSLGNRSAASRINYQDDHIRIVYLHTGSSEDVFVDMNGDRVFPINRTFYFSSVRPLEDPLNFPYENFYLACEGKPIELPENPLSISTMEYDGLPVYFKKNYANAAHVQHFFLYFDKKGVPSVPKKSSTQVRILTNGKTFYSYTTSKRKEDPHIVDGIAYYKDPNFVPAIQINGDIKIYPENAKYYEAVLD